MTAGLPRRRRYAIVGTGGRALLYVDGICGRYGDSCELVGLCDPSPTRMAFHNDRIVRKYGRPPVPVYEAQSFDRMIGETTPDIVIVTTVDQFHDAYIIRAMDLGCDVITEKPMTTTAAKAQAIFDAVDRTGRQLRVGFNYRYAPLFTAMRRVVAEGRIGRPQLVDFSWMLDTSHGADYFRRWHREKQNSGGLLVHKATHHFDLVNWWIDSRPETVFAMGDLRFYGQDNAEARGHAPTYARYTGVAEAAGDPFRFDLTSHPALRRLYYEAEADSGYVRDQNVFGAGITIEDTMAVTARYRNGAMLSYSLVAYSPWEGLRVAITGDRGRVELFERHDTAFAAAASPTAGAASDPRHTLTVQPMFGPPEPVPVDAAGGDHGGGDAVMLDDLLPPDPPPDPDRRAASHLDGAASIILGISANRSIEQGVAVRCDDLLPIPSSETFAFRFGRG